MFNGLHVEGVAAIGGFAKAPHLTKVAKVQQAADDIAYLICVRPLDFYFNA